MQNTSARIDGRFIATILETAAVGTLFLGWRSITEGMLLLLSHDLSLTIPPRTT